MTRPVDKADIAVIGAGAAGLMAGIWAAREAGPSHTIIAFDGAKTLGAKILVAGGGRCNVTHHAVDENAYAGSSRHAIKKVLRSFSVERTIDFFREPPLEVELKREETGKLFPTTDKARTVLDALLRAGAEAGLMLLHPWRVQAIRREGDGFVIEREPDDPLSPERETLSAKRVVLATGGLSLPRSGSDGHGLAIARSLGHTTTPRLLPALVPLLLAPACPLLELSGLTLPAALELRSGTGKRLVTFTNSTLCTHFGLSGPSVLDISRYYLDAEAEASSTGAPRPTLVINWLPGTTPDTVDRALQNAGNASPVRVLTGAPFSLPERLVRALAAHLSIEPGAPCHTLTRDKRKALVGAITEYALPVTGNRGYTYAEVTAGGVPLSEIELGTMESRLCPGLFLCGEICDVDGRIGGFNFQWAWSSGYLAGRGAAASLARVSS